MLIKLVINGKKETWDVKPSITLLEVLRKNGYIGAKNGCDNGDCGACTVILDGKSVKSCLLLAVQVNGRKLETIEGLSKGDRLHPLQEAFVKTGAVQCGFCIPGMIISAKALLDKNKSPTEEEVKLALDGNLCRCTGYVKQLEAVKMVAKELRGE
ncbi:MAG: (2Fe-2S)-binding protein [Candidatus Hodarchaeales archaeon]